VPLAALLAQPHPEPAVLREDIFDRHPERGADPGEGIDHQSDQRAVPQSGMGRDIDAVEQRARFRRVEHVTTWREPRTEPAGLTGTTCPVTSQSNR